MRVSFILDAFSGGGKERRCLQLIQGLESTRSAEVQVVLINNGIEYAELHKTSAVIEVIDRKARGLSMIQTVRELNAVLSSFRPDVVQAWGVMSAGVVLLVKIFFRQKFKFIASYVANVNPPKKFSVDGLITRLCNCFCDRIVGNSRAGLKVYRVPESKATLIYNGFNEDRFLNKIENTAVKRDGLGLAPGYVVAMFASFSAMKDWKCFLEAAGILIKKRADISFLCVGDGPDRAGYETALSDSERERVLFTGRRDDVDELYQICDLTVLTSTRGEGVSNSIMESMAWGVPCIASNTGGTPEIIEDGVNGILIKSQTPEELASLIETALDDSGYREQLSKAAARTVRDRFLLERMTRDYLDLYSTVK